MYVWKKLEDIDDEYILQENHKIIQTVDWYLNDINWLSLILFNTNHTFKATLYTNVLLSVCSQ